MKFITKLVLLLNCCCTPFFLFSQKQEQREIESGDAKIVLVGENHRFLDTSVQFSLIRNALQHNHEILILLEIGYNHNYQIDSAFKVKSKSVYYSFKTNRTPDFCDLLIEYISTYDLWGRIRIKCVDILENRFYPINTLERFLYDNEFETKAEKIKNRAFVFPKLVRKKKLKYLYSVFEKSLREDSIKYINKYGRKLYNEYYLNSLGAFYYLKFSKFKVSTTLRDTFMYQVIKREISLDSSNIVIGTFGALHTYKKASNKYKYQDETTIYQKNLYYYLNGDAAYNGKIKVYKYLHVENKTDNILNYMNENGIQLIKRKCTIKPCVISTEEMRGINKELSELADYFIWEY